MRISRMRITCLFVLTFVALIVISAVTLYNGSAPQVLAAKLPANGVSAVYLPAIARHRTPTPTPTSTSTSTPTPTLTPTPSPTVPPTSSVRRVNAPFFTGDVWAGGSAIFWFGRILPTGNGADSENYADVRVGYNATELYVRVSVFDRRLWYNPNPTTDALTNWDAASVYVDMGGNSSGVPDTKAYRFVGQMTWWENPRTNWQAAYRGNGTGWQSSTAPFTTEFTWRGDAPNNNNDDNGWWEIFHIPFSSLGLSGPPAQGTTWALGVNMYNRDSQAGPPLAVKVWPETMSANNPSTWGQLSFGLPAAYTPPSATPGSTVSIKNGVAGAVVTDDEVGGNTTCGQGLDIWSQWGQKNYAGQTQINIQNQEDVSDWPCFSKYYITFPLSSLPAGKVVISSTLTLYQFGNAGQGFTPGPLPSVIQVYEVDEDWNPNTLNWNNAPLPAQYVSSATVNPVTVTPAWPGLPQVWDVSSAVAKAYAAGRPLRLVLYSADLPMHSGKYFYSSSADLAGRPTLQVQWGNPN